MMLINIDVFNGVYYYDKLIMFILLWDCGDWGKQKNTNIEFIRKKNEKQFYLKSTDDTVLCSQRLQR